MAKAKRVQYTPEFRQEAVRLVESGESIAAAARSLGVVEQTLDNWVRAHRAGTLKGAGNKPSVSAEQMENSRLRAELARVTSGFSLSFEAGSTITGASVRLISIERCAWWTNSWFAGHSVNTKGARSKPRGHGIG
jgi:transposase